MAKAFQPTSAMILAAGLGARLRPMTDHLPKPLLQFAGRTVIDHALDKLVRAGVRKVVVNVHHKAAMLRGHLVGREQPAILISDESDKLLETGGGVANALAHLGPDPFFVINGDTLWFDAGPDSLATMIDNFDADRMDALLMLHPTIMAIGYDGVGDFNMEPDGLLIRRPENEVAPFVFAGVQILSPALFEDCPSGAFSLNLLYDRAVEAGRLYGIRQDGDWMNLNTMEGLIATARALDGLTDAA
ncbi:MAG: nucleotidyltransferase family protein [Alphaproteobacteria bacterium]